MKVKEPVSRVTSALQALVLCALLAGCQTMGAASVPPPRPKKAIRYRRVAIVEFFDKSGYGGTAKLFTESLREKLAERTASTDVVAIPRSALPSLEDPFVGGTISVDVLVKARRDYLADALVVGSVDSHHPYCPPSAHISLKVIDTATAAVPCEVSDGWDAGRQNVRSAIDSYYRRNIGSDDCRFGPDLFLISPRYFLKFLAATVADRLVSAL